MSPLHKTKKLCAGIVFLYVLCPGRELNPHAILLAKDFKSFVSTDFTTWAGDMGGNRPAFSNSLALLRTLDAARNFLL